MMFGGQCQDMQSDTGDDCSIVRRVGVLWDRKDCDDGAGREGLDGRLGGRGQDNADSSAAKSIASRRGAGRVRHIEVRELLVQDRVAKGEHSAVKLKG